MTIPSWAALILAMERAENLHGCGYYNNDDWIAAYEALKVLAFDEARQVNHMRKNRGTTADS